MHTSFQKLVLQGRPEVPGLFVHSKEGDMLTGALRQVDESLKELKKSLMSGVESKPASDGRIKTSHFFRLNRLEMFWQGVI